MTTTTSPPTIQPIARRPDTSWIEIVRILLLVQGAIAATVTIESFVAAAAQGFVTLPIVVVTLVGTGLTLLAARNITYLKRGTRRLVVFMQVGWLSFAGVDLLLSVIMTKRPFELVPTLTRIVLPLAIFRMLRSRRAREAFGIRASRKDRRSAKRILPSSAVAR